MKLSRVTAALVLATALVQTPALHANTYVVLSKTVTVQQLNATSASSSQEWKFEAFINGASATTPQVTVPSGTEAGIKTLTYNSSDGEWRYTSSTYASKSALNAAFANDYYAFIFGGTTGSPLAWTPTVTSSSFAAAAPLVSSNLGTWSDGTLTLSSTDLTQDLVLTLTWSAGGGFVSGTSRVGLDMYLTSGVGSYNDSIDNSSSSFTDSTVTLTIAANTLQAGWTLEVSSEFNKFVSMDSTTYASEGYTAVYLNTVASYFTIVAATTVPEPATFAALLGLVAWLGVAVVRRRRAV